MQRPKRYRNTKLLERLGKNVRVIRKKRGLSQEDLAEKAGITWSQVARIETSRINTTVSTLFAIMVALEVDANELLN